MKRRNTLRVRVRVFTCKRLPVLMLVFKQQNLCFSFLCIVTLIISTLALRIMIRVIAASFAASVGVIYLMTKIIN